MARDVCPNCGADLPKKANACPECGSDEQTGWSDEGHIGGLDLPDDDFDYDKFVSREFEKKDPKPQGIHWGWWVVAIVLVLLLIGPLIWSLSKTSMAR
jgi:hypothetical protein